MSNRAVALWMGAEEASSPISEDSDLPEIVDTAVKIAREIEAEPGNVGAILQRHDLAPESFEEMLNDISFDPELSRAYNSALN